MDDVSTNVSAGFWCFFNYLFLINIYTNPTRLPE